jgi:hypothetical protein
LVNNDYLCELSVLKVPLLFIQKKSACNIYEMASDDNRKVGRNQELLPLRNYGIAGWNQSASATIGKTAEVFCLTFEAFGISVSTLKPELNLQGFQTASPPKKVGGSLLRLVLQKTGLMHLTVPAPQEKT